MEILVFRTELIDYLYFLYDISKCLSEVDLVHVIITVSIQPIARYARINLLTSFNFSTDPRVDNLNQLLIHNSRLSYLLKK